MDTVKETLGRLWAWWLGQFRATSRLGKVAWIVVPLMFACCGLTLFAAVLSPDVEPAAELAERSATTAALEATQELVDWY